MQGIVKLLRAGRTFAGRFRADTKAIAAVEFALIVPVLLVMFFGTVEISSAVAIDRKVTLIARTVSDLTSQSSGTVTDTNLLNSFTAGIKIVRPYDYTPVSGAVSQIYIDTNSVAKIQWSKAAVVSGGAVSLTTSARHAGDVVTTMIPTALLIPSTYLILGEASYLYTPTVGYVVKSSITLSDVSYTRPRQVSCIIYNSVPTSC